jgi:hypothetical protein
VDFVFGLGTSLRFKIFNKMEVKGKALKTSTFSF